MFLLNKLASMYVVLESWWKIMVLRMTEEIAGGLE